MNIDIRQNIKNNFKDTNTDDIKASIESSISDGEEITLPGLGVFFEILWLNSDIDVRNVIIQNIEKGLK